MDIQVTNMKKSSDRPKPDGISDWLEYWEKIKGVTITGSYRCPYCKNTVPKTDLVGAHVVDNKRMIYITPLCRGCNNVNKTDSFQVEDSDMVIENTTRSANAVKELANKENNKFK